MSIEDDFRSVDSWFEGYAAAEYPFSLFFWPTTLRYMTDNKYAAGFNERFLSGYTKFN